jgi:hypothetical protein
VFVCIPVGFSFFFVCIYVCMYVCSCFVSFACLFAYVFVYVYLFVYVQGLGVCWYIPVKKPRTCTRYLDALLYIFPGTRTSGSRAKTDVIIYNSGHPDFMLPGKDICVHAVLKLVIYIYIYNTGHPDFMLPGKNGF